MKRLNVIIIFLVIFFVGCSKISKDDLVLTKWINGDGSVTCEFISMNTLEIVNNDSKIQFFYYIDDNNIIITRYQDHRKYIIQYKDMKLFLDAKAIGVNDISTIEFTKSEND